LFSAKNKGEMNTTPYWFDSSKRPKFLPLARPGSVDVLVVGAGVTGIVTTYLLKKAGLRKRVQINMFLSRNETGATLGASKE
jgi:ribulose 1,5-bisphosphate synthetase/thiazole synthase